MNIKMGDAEREWRLNWTRKGELCIYTGQTCQEESGCGSCNIYLQHRGEGIGIKTLDEKYQRTLKE